MIRPACASSAVLTLGWLLLVGCSGTPVESPPADPTPAAVTTETPTDDRPLVFIDPGHGGDNSGALGPSGAMEKDLVLAVATQLEQQLAHEGLVRVQLSRGDDEELGLVHRPRLANKVAADLFVSLHMNWSENTKATGIETYYLNTATDEAAERLARRENLNVEDHPTDLEAILADLRLAGNVDASRALAQRVHGSLLEGLEEFYGEAEVQDRGQRTALFAVLVRAEMPAVLVELCFLSNASEERRARTHAYQEKVAECLADGIIGFLRDQGRLPPPDPLGEPNAGR